MSHAVIVLDLVRRVRTRTRENQRVCEVYEDHVWSWGVRVRECVRCGRVER